MITQAPDSGSARDSPRSSMQPRTALRTSSSPSTCLPSILARPVRAPRLTCFQQTDRTLPNHRSRHRPFTEDLQEEPTLPADANRVTARPRRPLRKGPPTDVTQTRCRSCHDLQKRRPSARAAHGAQHHPPCIDGDSRPETVLLGLTIQAAESVWVGGVQHWLKRPRHTGPLSSKTRMSSGWL